MTEDDLVISLTYIRYQASLFSYLHYIWPINTSHHHETSHQTTKSSQNIWCLVHLFPSGTGTRTALCSTERSKATWVSTTWRRFKWKLVGPTEAKLDMTLVTFSGMNPIGYTISNCIYGCFWKLWVFPQIIHLLIGFSILFTINFGVPLFLETLK